MRYNVAQLLKAPIGAVRHYHIDEDVTGLDPDLVPTERLRGEVTLLRTGNGILVTGHLTTEVEVVCSRCLEPSSVALEVDLEEEFRPTVDVITGRHLLMEEEDQALWIDAQHILDLHEVVRQNLLLALPLHPLCREDCAGICPQCGQNLNEGPCDCIATEVDPRWSALLELKLDQ
ncbi:MAG TPA: DUF177 domain-containing protein [Caldilineae bacterium]|nr:DUF177 domain-containing protein [Caldilineae bacterium]